jgi:hypothetical protein
MSKFSKLPITQLPNFPSVVPTAQLPNTPSSNRQIVKSSNKNNSQLSQTQPIFKSSNLQIKLMAN